MDSKYFNERKVEYTDTDINLNLGIINMFDYAQDMGTAFFAKLKMDNETMKETYNSVWVISKIKLKNLKTPTWKDKVIGESYITNVGKVKMSIENVFKNENGDIYFIVNQEFCLIDLGTRRIKKVDEVNFPKDIETYSQINEDFLKLNDIKNEDNSVCYNRQIYLSDLDYSRHTNNTNYIKFMMDTLDESFIDKNKISEIDASYIRETKIGDKINIYKSEKENNIDILINNGDGDVFKAKIIS